MTKPKDTKEKKIYIKISHPDPKIEKQGVEAMKNFIKALETLMSEDIKIEEGKKT